MKKNLILFIALLVFSCIDDSKKIPNNFRTGRFKTLLEDKETISYATRNDSLQIETYDNKKDTFYIEWVGSFEYILLKKNPKSLLDSTPFHVKITGVKKKSYKFNAHYKGSNFKQKGEAFKID